MIGSPTFPRQSTLPLKFRTNPVGPTAPTMVVPPPGQSAVTAVGTEKQATLRNAPAGTPLNGSHPKNTLTRPRPTLGQPRLQKAGQIRSEERRVGKEWKSRWSPDY